tara:strand:+ start:25457 stop:25579 length:123 start_codon:yes stop_codon:yes gene_type:complete
MLDGDVAVRRVLGPEDVVEGDGAGGLVLCLRERLAARSGA